MNPPKEESPRGTGYRAAAGGARLTPFIVGYRLVRPVYLAVALVLALLGVELAIVAVNALSL